MDSYYKEYNNKKSNGSEEVAVLERDEELDTDYKEEGAVYPMTYIKVDKGFFSVYELKRKYDTHVKIILDSSFQREGVWSINKKIELIESVLMGLPLPIFYFNQDKHGNLIVIDGRQRLEALFQYIDNKFPLNGLKILPEYNAKRFRDLDPVIQSTIEDYQIQAHVILPPTPDKIKFDIFDRVNRAGVKLNKQEIRNALYQGVATNILNKIVKDSTYFSLATGNAFLKETRMKERYIVLRFIAFYLYLNNKLVDEQNVNYEYKNDIDELLGKTMEYMNTCDSSVISEIVEVTEKGLGNSYYYLGEDAFRLVKGKKKSAINMNIFETVMFVMFQLPFQSAHIKDFVNNKIDGLLANEDYIDNIGNHRDSFLKISKRFEMANNIVKDVMLYDKGN